VEASGQSTAERQSAHLMQRRRAARRRPPWDGGRGASPPPNRLNATGGRSDTAFVLGEPTRVRGTARPHLGGGDGRARCAKLTHTSFTYTHRWNGEPALSDLFRLGLSQ